MSGPALAEKLFYGLLVQSEVKPIGHPGIYTDLINQAQKDLIIVTGARQQGIWANPGFSAAFGRYLQRGEVEIVYIGEPLRSNADLDKARMFGKAKLYRLPEPDDPNGSMFMLADGKIALFDELNPGRVYKTAHSSGLVNDLMKKFADLKPRAIPI